MDIYLYLFQISTSVLFLICLDVLTPVITQTVLTRVLVLKGSGLTQTGRLVEVNTCNCHLNIQITFDNSIPYAVRNRSMLHSAFKALGGSEV